MDYYVPSDLKDGEKRPVIIVSPILGGNEVVDLFAKYYAERGFISVLVHRKKPNWEKGNEFQDIENHLRISVIRLRQVVDWLEKQPQVDAKRIGTFGISYGSIMHVNFVAIEKRVKFNVMCLGGAPIGDVLVDSNDKGIRERVKGMKISSGMNGDQIKEELRKVIKTAPEDLSKYINSDDVVFYVASFDMVVKTKHGFYLWNRLGKPKLKMTPLGHYTSVLLLPILQKQSYNEFKRRLIDE